MKLKFPKKIKIGDITWKIKYNKKEGGGSFSYGKKEIVIGCEDYKNQPLMALCVIIHELKEIIQENQSVRYKRTDVDSDYLFSYDHRHHTDFCYKLTELLDYFIK